MYACGYPYILYSHKACCFYSYLVIGCTGGATTCRDLLYFQQRLQKKVTSKVINEKAEGEERNVKQVGRSQAKDR